MLRLTLALSIFSLGTILSQGQEPAASPSPDHEDLKAIRQLVEQQSRQIESLTQQLTKLTHQLEINHNVSPATPVLQTAPPATSDQIAPSPAPEIPKAEAVIDPASTHVVAKGETLTSIARQHKVTVVDLEKANKIENDRKIQIGQTIKIPTPAKASESPTP